MAETLNYIKKDRDSNMELLRIVAMLMIIFHHFSVHGGFYFNTDYLGIPEIRLNIIAVGGDIGNNLFVLISGYFLVKSDLSEKIFIRKLMKLLLQVSFYSLLIYFICVGVITGFSNISLAGILDNLNPLGNYWFFDTYILLFLTVPFLNKLLLSLTKNQYLKFLLLLLVLNIIMLNIINSNWSSLFRFITLYSLSAYISLFLINKKLSTKSLIFYLILCLITLFSITFANRLDILGYDGITTIHSYNKNRILVFFISILIFLIFTKIKIKHINIVNVLASTTFGIYLIHDNNIIRSFIWKYIFNTTLYQESNIIIIYSIFVVIFIFLVCSIFDIIRQYFFERPFLTFFDKYIDYFIKKSCKISKKLSNIL